MKLRYHSEELAHRFEHHGAEDLVLRVDPDDLGHISFQIGEAWHVLNCTSADMRGVSLDSWKRAVLEVYQNNRAAARAGQLLVDDAIHGLRKIDDVARARCRLGPINLSAEELDRAERNLFLGVRFGPAEDGSGNREKLPGEAIAPILPAPVRPVPRSDEDGSDPDWRFSDDD